MLVAIGVNLTLFGFGTLIGSKDIMWLALGSGLLCYLGFKLNQTNLSDMKMNEIFDAWRESSYFKDAIPTSPEEAERQAREFFSAEGLAAG